MTSIAIFDQEDGEVVYCPICGAALRVEVDYPWEGERLVGLVVVE